MSLVVAFSCAPPPSCPKGTLRTVPVFLVAVEQTTTTSTMVFPAARGCELPEGTLTAMGTFIDANGATTPLTVTQLEHDPKQGKVTVSVSVLPTTTGLGELKLFVEPSLGFALMPVFIAQDGERLPVVEERQCPTGQPVTTGHFVCPADGGVEVRFQGTTVQRFEGATGPQVAGTTLWFELAVDGGLVMERHFLAASGAIERSLRSNALVSTRASNRFVNEALATRRGAVASVGEDGGLVFSPIPFTATSEIVLPEGNRLFAFKNDRWCELDGGCFPINVRSRLAGFDDVVWWEAVNPEVNARKRPVGDGGISATLPFGGGTPLTPRDLNAVFRPTWLGDAGALVAEWNADAGAVVLIRFDKPMVPTFQSRDYVGFTSAGTSRFYRLSR
jgi:hypothetical protein